MFFYDFLRIHRRIRRIPDFMVNLEDFIFAALSAIAVFYITYVKNNGEIRWQTAGGLILGGGLYMFLIRDRFVRAVCFVWGKTVRIIIKILRVLLAPVVFIGKIILKPARVVLWYSGRKIKGVGRSVKIKETRAKIKLKYMGYIMRKK